jgi:hypothetical protein
LALIGESGIQKYTNTAQITVMRPYVMNIASHDLSGDQEGTKENPKAKRPPTIFWSPFIMYLLGKCERRPIIVVEIQTDQ